MNKKKKILFFVTWLYFFVSIFLGNFPSSNIFSTRFSLYESSANPAQKPFVNKL